MRKNEVRSTGTLFRARQPDSLTNCSDKRVPRDAHGCLGSHEIDKVVGSLTIFPADTFCVRRQRQERTRAEPDVGSAIGGDATLESTWTRGADTRSTEDSTHTTAGRAGNCVSTKQGEGRVPRMCPHSPTPGLSRLATRPQGETRSIALMTARSTRSSRP